MYINSYLFFVYLTIWIDGRYESSPNRFQGVKYIPAPGLTQKLRCIKKLVNVNCRCTSIFPKTGRQVIIVQSWSFLWRRLEGGSTQQFLFQANYFASRGIVTARADYRVKSRDGVSPDLCVEDARSAVRWLRANADKLGIDTNKVIASGGSAGGHLAFCTSIKQGLDATSDDKSISCIPQVMVLYNPALFVEFSQGSRKSGTGTNVLGET